MTKQEARQRGREMKRMVGRGALRYRVQSLGDGEAHCLLIWEAGKPWAMFEYNFGSPGLLFGYKG